MRSARKALPDMNLRRYGTEGQLLAECTDNQTRNVLVLEQPVRVHELRLELDAPAPNVPAAPFENRCDASKDVPS